MTFCWLYKILTHQFLGLHNFTHHHCFFINFSKLFLHLFCSRYFLPFSSNFNLSVRQGPKPLRISIIFSWLELSHSLILSLSQFRFVGVGLNLIFGHGSWVSRCLSYRFIVWEQWFINFDFLLFMGRMNFNWKVWFNMKEAWEFEK